MGKGKGFTVSSGTETKTETPADVKTEAEVKEVIATKKEEIQKEVAKLEEETKAKLEQDKKYKTVMVKIGVDKYGTPTWKAQRVLIE